MTPPTFRYVDLFAGIGGFHAVLSALGGECVYSVEIDPAAAAVYSLNWGMDPLGDVTKDATEQRVLVPPHDVLAAGFPCQPFSKSGAQRGMDETRGTLYWYILRIVQEHHPRVLLLENVRNLAGPRHAHEWAVIISTLLAEGYRVSETPAVFSPHLLPREQGGRPQVRERVFITATWDPHGLGSLEDVRPPLENVSRREREWDLATDLPLDPDEHVEGCDLSDDEVTWIDAWNVWVRHMWSVREDQAQESGEPVRPLPGFPIWSDDWRHHTRAELNAAPAWKRSFLVKNEELWAANKEFFGQWKREYKVATFPPSRRKLEWQAQFTASLWDCVMQMRPSGIRAKRPTHLPALVAIAQTPIIGPRRRRLSPREAARLQGLPDSFDFGNQRTGLTYKQLGNGVNIGAAWTVLKAHVVRDAEVLGAPVSRTGTDGQEYLDHSGTVIASAVLSAPDAPDEPVAALLEPHPVPSCATA